MMDNKIQITFEEYKNIISMIISENGDIELVRDIITKLDSSNELNSDMLTILRLCNFLYSLDLPFYETNFGNVIGKIVYPFHYVNVELNADLSFLKAYMEQVPVSPFISQFNKQNRQCKYLKDFFRDKYSL